MKQFEFWFSIGSTYTYLTVQRISRVEKDTGIEVIWRPFSVRVLMQEMNNVPFIGKPAKEAYMWRDLQRRAEKYGMAINVPFDYPLKEFDLANRIAVVAQQEGWCENYVRATYQNWVQNGMPAGEEANIVETFRQVEQPVERVLQLANSEVTEAAYQLATSEARLLGVFGSPSFVVNGNELFWGDDRLEDAIEFWHKS